jgi:hypothetical protein
MRESLYDRVASLLISLLVILGLLVACLAVMWLSNKFFAPHPAVPVTVIPDVTGGGVPDGMPNESLEIQSPNPELIARESELTEPKVEDMVAMIIDAVATKRSDLADPAITEEVESGGAGSSTGDGRHLGLGLGGGPGSGVPRHLRWEINWQQGATLALYASQLDYFGIELGAVGNVQQVVYLKSLGKPKPDTFTGWARDEKRLLFTWKKGSALESADRQLFSNAGVATEGKIIVQIYPPATENLLVTLELAYANRKQEEIRKTRFGVRSRGRQDFEFYVIDQTPL